MATPTLGLLNHTLLTSADANTGWTLLTGEETDIKKEGTASRSGIFRANLSSGYYQNAGGAISAVGKTIRGWVSTSNMIFMQPESLGGYEFQMFDGTTTEYKVAFGSDTYEGGWKNFVVSASLFTTLTLANAVRWGWRANHHTNARNVVNTWADAIRYLDGYYITGGTSGDKLDFYDVAVADRGTPVLTGYGIITEVDSVYFATGKLVIGNGSTSTHFEMNGDVLVFTNQQVATGLYQLTGEGTGCNITINNSVIKSVGTTANTRFLLDMDDADLFAMSLTNNVIDRASTCTFKSGQTVTGNTFNNCLQIIPDGANLSSSKVLAYEGTVDTASLVWNSATDPDGFLDDMEFTKGTASTHAIEFGTSSPTSITIRNISFSGYNASNAQTDSTFLVSRTTGTVTINLVGCSGNMTYKSAGATVVLVADPVTTAINVKDLTTGNNIENARVLIWATDNTNYFYEASVTITSSGTIATVAHTGHGTITGDKVRIKGANEDAFNGAYTITYIDANSYSYTMNETPTSPATGTITSTFVFISGLTDASGNINDTRTLSNNQAITGWIRKSSSSPYYQQGIVSGIINNATGFSTNIILIRDE